MKKVNKIMLLSAVGVALLGAVTGCDDNSDSSENSSQSSKPKPHLTKKQRINKEIKRGQKIYEGKAKVAYNKEWNAITITPTSQSFTASVVDVISNGDGQSQSWKDLTNTLKDLSTAVIERTKIANISVALVNPNNPDKVLYTACNGRTTYDLAKDGD